jgi:ABC-type sugar transport system permease subunit
MRTHSRLAPWLFMGPLILLLLFVFGQSLVRVVEFSFKMIRGIDGPWIGFRNYRLVLGQPLFWESVGHNLLLLLAIPVMVALSLLIALLLYERVRGWKAYRTVLFLPYILAIPIIAVVAKQMLQLEGPVNEVLRALSLDFLALDWIGSGDVALWTVMLLIIWRESALGVILFLSRLLALDESLVEAAKIEGANWWQRAWHVLIPQLRSVIEFFAVISAITLLTAVFAYVYMIGGGRGGPGTSTMVVELYIYNALTRQSLPGVAAAVSVMVFLVAVLLIGLLFRLRRVEEA